MRHEPIRLFCSYAHEDEKLRAELEKQLIILKHAGLLAIWHDRMIMPGKRSKTGCTEGGLR